MNLYVKLTNSSNEFLPYPCYGLLEVLETGRTGNVIVAVFRRMERGRLQAPVRVNTPTFSYSPRNAGKVFLDVAECLSREEAATRDTATAAAAAQRQDGARP